MRRFGRILAVLLVLVLVVLLGACSGNQATQNAATNKSGEGSFAFTPLSYDKAKEALASYFGKGKIEPTNLIPMLDPNQEYDLDLSYEAMSLPNLSEYPFVVEGETPSFIRVYSTRPEVIQAAKDFNAAKEMIDGEQVSVAVRAIPPVIARNFVLAERQMPDVLVSTDEIGGCIIQDRAAVPIKMIADTTIRNVSGVVVLSKTGIESFSDLVRALQDKQLTIGYVDPLQDSNGLNFILAALSEFDNTQPLGETATEGLKKLQGSITLIANDYARLKKSFLQTLLGGYVLDYEMFLATPEYNTENSLYTFIPFGVAQKHPMYTIGELNPIKEQTAQRFAEYCKRAGEASALDATIANYHTDIAVTPTVAGDLSRIYRSVKGGTSSVATVMLVDTSGSQEGEPNRMVKTAMRGIFLPNVVNPKNAMGLVLFNNRSRIAVPLGGFNGEQQSYLSNAITVEMNASGGTAMYDGIAVAMQMLLDYQALNPDTKLVIYVLTDGISESGKEYADLAPIIAGLGIPVYTIGFKTSQGDLNEAELEALSAINEASYIDAGMHDVSYILPNTLGALMS